MKSGSFFAVAVLLAGLLVTQSQSAKAADEVQACATQGNGNYEHCTGTIYSIVKQGKMWACLPAVTLIPPSFQTKINGQVVSYQQANSLAINDKMLLTNYESGALPLAKRQQIQAQLDTIQWGCGQKDASTGKPLPAGPFIGDRSR